MNINLFVFNFKMSLEIVENENSVSLYSYLGNENNFNTIFIIIIVSLILLGFIPQLCRFVRGPTIVSEQSSNTLVSTNVLCDVCKTRKAVQVEVSSKALAASVLGTERMTILFRRGHLGSIDSVEFQRLCAEMDFYFRYGKLAYK
jgi:hypothetical protein